MVQAPAAAQEPEEADGSAHVLPSVVGKAEAASSSARRGRSGAGAAGARSEVRVVDRMVFLDGLRGVLCAVVVLHHFLCGFWPCLIFGRSTFWLSSYDSCAEEEDDRALWVARHFLPLFNGAFAVAGFFVLSGFVLSFRMLSGSADETPMWVAKRFFRLCLPCAAASVFAYALGGGTSNVEAAAVTTSKWLHYLSTRRPLPMGLVRQIVWGTWFGGATLNNAMWTMKLEFYGSLLVFLLVAVIAGSGSQRARAGVLVPVMLFVLGSSTTVTRWSQVSVAWPGGNISLPLSGDLKPLFNNRTMAFRFVEGPRHQEPVPLSDDAPGVDTWPVLQQLEGRGADEALDIVIESHTGWGYEAPLCWYAPFVSGVMLACLHQPERGGPGAAPALARRALGPLSSLARLAAAGLALLCASYPSLAPKLVRRSRVFTQMMLFNKHYLHLDGPVVWYTLGATCLVHSTLSSPLCRDALSSRAATWLGEVSFGLYLTHIPIIYTFTCRLFLLLLAAGASYVTAAALAFAVSVALMLAVAQVFTRYVDGPSIRRSADIGKWLLGLE